MLGWVEVKKNDLVLGSQVEKGGYGIVPLLRAIPIPRASFLSKIPTSVILVN
jgi:hypothetical protein